MQQAYVTAAAAAQRQQRWQRAAQAVAAVALRRGGSCASSGLCRGRVHGGGTIMWCVAAAAAAVGVAAPAAPAAAPCRVGCLATPLIWAPSLIEFFQSWEPRKFQQPIKIKFILPGNDWLTKSN